jgi:predicted  nucleic acid-binding Zn-ribbon protein
MATLRDTLTSEVVRLESELAAAREKLTFAESNLGAWINEEEEKAKEFFAGLRDKLGF